MIVEKLIGAALLSAVLLVSAPFVHAQTQRHPALVMHGDSYANACDDTELTALKQQLPKTPVQSPENLWRVIETVLCAPAEKGSRAYIARQLSSKVKQNFAGNSELKNSSLPFPDNDIAAEIMAAQRAWNANLRVEENKVVLQYFTDEACVIGIGLAFVKSVWVISEVSDACD